jgi:hypothetical protein
VARQGTARQGRQGMVWRGRARLGNAGMENNNRICKKS